MRSTTAYNSQYIEQCFGVWYSSGQPSLNSGFAARLPKDEYGRLPSPGVLQKWMSKYQWIQRAAELDNRAIELRDNSLVIQKAELLRKQAMDAFRLADHAHQFLLSGTFDSSAAAVNAYFRSTEEIRKVVGLSDLLQRLGDMSDEEVQDEIKKRLARAAESNQIIVDGEELASNSDEETS